MTPPDFSRLRPGLPGCPSDLTLDRLYVHELTGTNAAEIESHVGSCTSCAERMSQRIAGFNALDVDPRRLLARIRVGAEEGDASTFARGLAWLRKLLMPVVTVGGVAALALVAAHQHGRSHLESDAPIVNRTKGPAVLHVYRLTESGSEEAVSGDVFTPGTRIRFGLDLRDDGYVEVVGTESSGRLYTAWPLDEKGSLKQRKGEGIELPGAVSLDSSVGRDTLYLVYCPMSVGTPACRSRGAEMRPVCTPGCELSPFVLEKAP